MKKPAPQAAPKPKPIEPKPTYHDVVKALGPVLLSGEDEPVDVPSNEGDHHNMPDRAPIARAHDLVRGCWCFPEIKGSEVFHR